MMKHTYILRSARRRAGTARDTGFSLMEVLVALGIFSVGLVAVAAIFPTAITIQRDTVREVTAQRVGKNAQSVVLAIARSKIGPSPPTGPAYEHELTYDPNTRQGTLASFVISDTTVKKTLPINQTPMLPMIDQPPGNTAFMSGLQSFNQLFNLHVRSYPKSISDPDRRDYYWYPLLKVADLYALTPKFSVTLMVMRRDGTDLPPQVRLSHEIDPVLSSGNKIYFNPTLRLFDNGAGNVDNDQLNNGLPDYIQAGDQIIGNDGLVHQVVIADKNSLTLSSPVLGKMNRFYFAVAIEQSGNIRIEGRSPLIWVEKDIPISP